MVCSCRARVYETTTAEAVGVFTPRQDVTAPQVRIFSLTRETSNGRRVVLLRRMLQRRGARQGSRRNDGTTQRRAAHSPPTTKLGKPKNLTANTSGRVLGEIGRRNLRPRIGVHFSDLGMAALRDGSKPGLKQLAMVGASDVSKGEDINVIYGRSASRRWTRPTWGCPVRWAGAQPGGDVVVARSAQLSGIIPEVLRLMGLQALSRPTVRRTRNFDLIAAVLKAGVTRRRGHQASSVI